jgi:UPF0755 protein
LIRALLVLLLLGALGALVARDVERELFMPLPLAEPVAVDIPRGTSLDGLLRQWQSRGVLTSARQRLYLSIWARVSGQARSIKAGEYEFTPGMRAVDVMALMVSGRVKLHELTIVEGWRFDQALSAIRLEESLTHSMPDADAAALMTALGRKGLHPEGRFYPDTYRFPRGTTEIAFLRRALESMDDVLASAWAARADGLPYKGPDEALVMASIVERETGVVEERPAIAGVFVRRLEQGMRLQTDPAVIYGLGNAFDGNLRKRDLLADSPYNTYTRRGLPPTPICLPGRAAIHASLHPAPGKTLYFVARGDGSHQFSETIAEHEAAVRKYQLRRHR